MNERIKELAEQAGADFMRRINYNNLEGKEYEEDAGIIFESNESFEKFAELIIKECAIVANRADNTETEIRCMYDVITEHFGVKE